MHAARFGCYISGGRPRGARRTYLGCRDQSPPRRDVGIHLAGGLTFAGRSSVWGGGMAFYNPHADGELAARAYLLTFGQLSDVVAQEARRPVGSDLALDSGVDRRWPAPSHVYETLLHVDDRDGLPMLTITSLQNLEPTPPSAALPSHHARRTRRGVRLDRGRAGALSVACARRHPGVDRQPTRRAVRRRALTGGSRTGMRSPMTVIGFHCSHEQINPAQLLRDVQQAERAGFTAGMSSDHFSPWSARQGESGFAWSFLGAALATTRLPFGVVNAPGQRYHPAIIAQAIATLAQMFPGRFWAALGSGEASNERVTGEVWPRKELRDQRLIECVEVIRRLLAGEEVSHDGLVHVNRARLWTLPRDRPRPRRPGGHPRDRGPPRRVGGRPDHRQPVEGDASEGPRLVPRGRRSGPGPPSDPPQLGARRRTRPSPSPTTSGAATSSALRSPGTSRRSRRSTSSARTSHPSR